VYTDKEGNKYRTYENNSLYDSYYDLAAPDFYSEFSNNDSYIEDYLNTLSWEKDGITSDFDEDAIYNYVDDNLEDKLRGLDLFDILTNHDIYTINDIIKDLYKGNKEKFIKDLNTYSDIDISKKYFPFDKFKEYLNKGSKKLKEFDSFEYFYKDDGTYNNGRYTEDEIKFLIKEKDNIFSMLYLPGDEDTYTKNLLYVSKAISKKENDEIIIELCDKIKNLYSKSMYLKSHNIILDKSGKLLEYINQLNLYLYKKSKKYKYPIAFYLSSFIYGPEKILSQEYVDVLIEKVREMLMNNGNIIYIIKYYFSELSSYSDLTSNGFFIGDTIEFTRYIDEMVRDYIYQNVDPTDMISDYYRGSFEYNGDTYHVSDY
jgi:hypothetical protein